MLQDAGEQAAGAEQAGAELLRRLPEPYRFPMQGYRRHTDEAIKAERRYMQHVLRQRFKAVFINLGLIRQPVIYQLRGCPVWK